MPEIRKSAMEIVLSNSAQKVAPPPSKTKNEPDRRSSYAEIKLSSPAPQPKPEYKAEVGLATAS